MGQYRIIYALNVVQCYGVKYTAQVLYKVYASNLSLYTLKNCIGIVWEGSQIIFFFKYEMFMMSILSCDTTLFLTLKLYSPH